VIFATTAPGDIAAKALLAIAVVVLVGRLAGAVCERIGQPRVIGEILAGIALGPSLLGLISPDLTERLFPAEVVPSLRVLAEFGLVLFMFIVGLEVDLGTLRSNRRRAVAISLTSIATPFVLATVVLAPILYGDHDVIDGAEVRFTPFALILGVSMCGTAFAILARILSERNMFAIPLGMTLIAAAAVDDLVSFTLLAFVTAVGGSTDGLSGVPITLASMAAFVAVMAFVGRPILRRLVLDPFERNGRMLTPEIMAVLFVGALGSGFATYALGLHSLIGAFTFGALLPRDAAGHLFHAVVGKVEGVSTGLLLPVFFVITGLNVDIGGLGTDSILPLVLIIVVASVGKFVGGSVAARLTGVSTRQSMAVGVLMNTRGLSELVILNIGRSLGLIDAELFTMLVIMAVTTTALSGPLLKLVYPDRWLARDIAEAQRVAADTADRVVVVVDDPAVVAPVHLASAVTASGGELVIVHPHAPMSAVQMVGTLEALERLGRDVSDPRLRIVVRTVALDDLADTASLASLIASIPASAVVVDPFRADLAEALGGAVDVVTATPDFVPGAVALRPRPGRSGAAALEVAARVAVHGDWPVAIDGDDRAAASAHRSLTAIGVRIASLPDGAVSIGEWDDRAAPIRVSPAIGERPQLTERFDHLVQQTAQQHVERVAQR
jgi:Kef-type K+ transport system membrane component KefB